MGPTPRSYTGFCQKSEENWKVGMQCVDSGEFSAAANRLYYAILHAVNYWAFEKKLMTYSERNNPAIGHGTWRDLLRDKGGANSADFADVLGKFKSRRVTADYRVELVKVSKLPGDLLRQGDHVRREMLRRAGR